MRSLPVLTAAAVLGLAAAAPAQTGEDTASLSLSPKKAGSSTALTVRATFAPRIIDRVTVVLPKGAKLTPKAVATCDDGAAKDCPAGSKVGSGTATATLGDGPPTPFTLGIYSTSTGILFDILLNGVSAYTSEGTLKGRRLTIDLSRTPELQARITKVSFTLRKGGTKAKPYLAAPATCPSSRRLAGGALEARTHQGATAVLKTTVRCSR